MREELIAALVTDKYSGFKEVDTAMLGAASDVRLEEFRVAAEARRAAATETERAATEHRQTTARLKVAEEKIVKLEQPISDEDFVARLAPTSPIKAMLETRAAEEKTIKSQLVAALKDVGAETEEQLNKKTIPELQTLAQYARVKVLDFSGRGMPVERNAQQTVSYAPPKPYTMAIEAQKKQSA